MGGQQSSTLFRLDGLNQTLTFTARTKLVEVLMFVSRSYSGLRSEALV